ncbi:MAG: transposase [Bacteroidales bacterium]|nr:transposase [Bacteroidales bacterium]
MRIIESSFRELYDEYLSSGLTVRDFCANQDFAVSTFYRWQKLLKEKEQPKEFVPLVMEQTAGHPILSVEQEKCEDETNELEFTFPNGTKLQLKGHVDAALLKTIVHLY